MTWFRKHFLLLLLSAFVYGAFFLMHLSTPTTTREVLGVDTNLMLFEEPANGRDFLLSAVDTAQKEIDIEMYLLTDKVVITHLENAHMRGIIVNVLLEQHPFGAGGINQKTKQELESYGITVKWTNPAYSLTHEKAIVVDNKIVFILNQNLTAASFGKNREYDIEDANFQDVAEIKKIFVADWNRIAFSQTDSHLLISPINAREGIQQLITTSQKNLDIETEVIDDAKIVSDLCGKAQDVAVRVVVPDNAQVAENEKQLSTLRQCGVQTKTLKKPYIHAKLLIADQHAYIGSINLTTQSLDENREVGIVITQPDILSRLAQDFEIDWNAAQSL